MRCLSPLSAIVALAALLPAGMASPAAELELRFRDGDGKPVRVARAELLLVAWGVADRLPLSVDHDVLSLDLLSDWLRSRWPGPISSLDRAYLLVHADGFAPLRSEPFPWLGSRGDSHGPRVESTTVDFRQGRSATLREGDRASLEVTLRRPLPKALRLVDEAGQPVAGLEPKAFLYWSADNHCGALSGAEPLTAATSAADGRLAVDDADAEVALELPEGAGWALAAALGTPFPRRFVGHLPAGETTLVLHRYRTRPLALRFLRDGRPVAGATLVGALDDCCGACSGPLAVTDAEGWARVEGLPYEQLLEVSLEGGDGAALWRASPGELPTQPQLVELAAAGPPGP